MSSPSPRRQLAVATACIAIFGCSAMALATGLGGIWPAWMLVLFGFLVGLLSATLLAYVGIVRPLRIAARACDRVAAGDISQSLPESGPDALRTMAKVFNTVLADFQEVMLLFAYFVRSAQASLKILRDQADDTATRNTVRSLCSSTLDDLRSMQEMIEGFRYFRVRIEKGTVTDSGVPIRCAEADSTPTSHPSRVPDVTVAPRA